MLFHFLFRVSGNPLGADKSAPTDVLVILLICINYTYASYTEQQREVSRDASSGRVKDGGVICQQQEILIN